MIWGYPYFRKPLYLPWSESPQACFGVGSHKAWFVERGLNMKALQHADSCGNYVYIYIWFYPHFLGVSNAAHMHKKSGSCAETCPRTTDAGVSVMVSSHHPSNKYWLSETGRCLQQGRIEIRNSYSSLSYWCCFERHGAMCSASIFGIASFV